MATVTKGYTFGATEEVTAAKLHSLVDSASVTAITNADLDAGAAIVDTQLATINTAGKVDGGALTGLANVPSGAGYLPVANLSAITTTQISASAGILGTQLEAKIDDTGKISGKAFTELADTPSGAGAVPIANGGTGQTTAQLAINALTAVSAATNEYVLTKDTATGNATFKVLPSSSIAYTAGSLVEASAATSRTTSSTSYTKLKEFSALQRAGTITVSFTLTSGGNASARVYKNSSAVGTERTSNNTYAENFTVAIGDIIQIYAKKVDSDPTITNTKILVANPTVPTEQTDY
jgi:hypothetical protein